MRFVSKDITGDRYIEDGAGDNPFESTDKLPIHFELDLSDPFTKHFAETYCKGKHILSADEIQGINTAFALQNNNRLSDEDKKNLIPGQTDKPAIKPELQDLSTQADADYKPNLDQTIYPSTDPVEIEQMKAHEEASRVDNARAVLAKIPGSGVFQQ